LLTTVRSYHGLRPKANKFEAFVSDIADTLPRKVGWEVVFESVRHLAGQQLTKEVLSETSLRLAGNVERLMQQRTVAPWEGQKFPEWVSARITKVKLRRGGRKGKQLGHEFVFNVVGGTSASLEIIKWWSPSRQRHVATFKNDKGYGFKFARRRSSRMDAVPKNEFHHAAQFVKLRCLLLIEPKLCDEEGPDFKEVAFTSAMANWNQEIHRRRSRLTEKYRCPLNFGSNVLCYHCPIGLDKCSAAVHAVTYEHKQCDRCGENSFHDPADRVHHICVSCVDQLVLKPEDEED
jgi:hypothetical protein